MLIVYYYTDHQGGYYKIIYRVMSPIFSITEYDAETNPTLYKPYGSIYQSENNGMRYYTGKEWDKDAKLYYYGARDYDPDLGLFLQPDPAMQNPKHLFI